MKYPTISVVIPTYNEISRISRCLESIRLQKYPASRKEIIIVDDGSTDGTLEVAKKYGAKIYYNGTKHPERGKSIGIEKARGEYIFLIDGDNRLTSNYWFKTCINILNENKDVVGVESWRLKYKKTDSIINRYSALFGVVDPLVYYLGKKGWLMAGETITSKNQDVIKNKKDYYLARYTDQNLPTIGSNGYMIRKTLLKKTHWKPYFFHLDSTYELVKKGHNTFAKIKFDIEHDYADSLLRYLKKLRRNIFQFTKYKSLRTYKYNMNFLKLVWVSFVMISLVVPLYDSIRGYFKKRDVAWFIHPLICFLEVPVCVVFSIWDRINLWRYEK